MTNVEIARILLNEAKKGALDRAIIPHFINSLQYGAPVSDPKAWLGNVAKDLGRFLPEVCSSKCSEQLKEIAARWDDLAAQAVSP